MVWLYIIAAFVIYLILDRLIRLPTVGKYGERYVFITGCDTGFGNMLAKRLDSLGFNVFAACLTERGEDELRKESSPRLKTISLDVSKPESIAKARETVDKNLPPNKGLWAVVNNAGIAEGFGDSEMRPRAHYEACLAVNLYGTIDVTRAFQPLVRKGQGRFVNMSSASGRISPSNAPYAVSKYGVEAFSDCLRREVLKQGMTVHIVEPGAFKTPILNKDNFRRAVQESYDNANPELQTYYGKITINTFLPVPVIKMAVPLIENASTKTYQVVDAYTHAITAMFPRPRYLVGNDCKYVLRIIWNLPEWISDRMCAAYYVTPEGAK